MGHVLKKTDQPEGVGTKGGSSERTGGTGLEIQV